MTPQHVTSASAEREEHDLVDPGHDEVAPCAIGLAISGRGVRSATFGLGVLEA
jgi:hypothetical protein